MNRQFAWQNLPVGSEQNVILQCLKANFDSLGTKIGVLTKIFLTVSNGPIGRVTKKQLCVVTRQQAFGPAAWMISDANELMIGEPEFRSVSFLPLIEAVDGTFE